MADRTVVADAFGKLLQSAVDDRGPKALYAQLDEEVVDTVLDTLAKHSAPHVLTIYLTGTDHYAHGANDGPDAARVHSLGTVVDPLLGRLRKALAQHHALSTDGKGDPPDVLRAAGFRMRAFDLETKPNADFSAVLAYGGAMAYVYVADRSTCPRVGDACDWKKPPRYEEDVLAAAEAFHLANTTGQASEKLKGALDLILTRRPRSFVEDDAPFEVYVGRGELVPVAKFLEQHPHPTYVAVAERLRGLAVGRFGERAGDLLLLAHNGDRDTPEERRYFAGLYRSWHGSPSRKDSEIPLVIAHPGKTSGALAAWTRRALGKEPRQEDVARLFLEAVGISGAGVADASP